MRLLKSKAAAAFFAAVITITPGVVAQSGRALQQNPQQAPQQEKNKRDDDTIRINTGLVTLTATVVNERGRYAANLKQSDFTVYENGVKQELAYFKIGDQVPISLGILFDTSGSMVDKIEGVRDAAEHYERAAPVCRDGRRRSIPSGERTRRRA
ncbi:MAG: hypothetical protein ACREEM_00870 [Blastocatellia bacterium]